MSIQAPISQILDQLQQDVASAWGLATSSVYQSMPETEVSEAHAVILLEQADSTDRDQFSSAKHPAMSLEISIIGVFEALAGSLTINDELLTAVDQLGEVIEVDTYADIGMMPLITNIEMQGVTGYQSGTGQQLFRVALTYRVIVQRSRCG